MAGLRGWAWARGRQKLDELTVDSEGLSSGHRWLILVGYAATVAILLAVLAAGAFAEPHISFIDSVADRTRPVRVPLVLAVVSAATFVVGWAFVLTGASDGGRRVFLPLLAICGITLIGLSDFAGGLTFTVGGSVLGVFVLFAARGSSDLWRNHPVVEYFAWLALMAIALGQTFVGGRPTLAVGALYAHASLVALLAIPFWILLGRDACPAAIDLGRGGSGLARQFVPDRLFRSAVAAVCVALLPITLFASQALGYVEVISPWLSFVVFISAPIAFWTATRIADGRWGPRSATLGLSLTIGCFVFALSVVSTMEETGLLERLIGALDLLPPLALFVFLAAYDVANVGTRYAERDWRHIPRTGGVLVYFGGLLLLIGSLALLLGADMPTGNAATEGPRSFPTLGLSLGLLFIGLPMFVHTLRHDRGRFVAEGDGLPHRPLSETSDPPSGFVRIVWMLVIGWWLVMWAIAFAFLLVATFVGRGMAGRLIRRLPAYLFLRGRPAPSSQYAPSDASLASDGGTAEGEAPSDARPDAPQPSSPHLKPTAHPEPPRPDAPSASNGNRNLAIWAGTVLIVIGLIGMPAGAAFTLVLVAGGSLLIYGFMAGPTSKRAVAARTGFGGFVARSAGGATVDPEAWQARAARHEPVVVVDYVGKTNAEASTSFRTDAAIAALHGYSPTTQQWAQGQYGCGAYLIALLLCIVLIGVLIIVYMLFVRPPGTLSVTYGLQALQPKPALPMATSGAAVPVVTPERPNVSDTKVCPDCAETVKAAAKVCRYCRHEFEPGPTPPVSEPE